MIPLVKVGLPDKNILMPILEQVLYSGMIAEGEQVYDFENKFAKHFGLDVSLAMSSGTAALHASLVLAGVKLGDEVITTSMTAEPTNVVIMHVGGIPVFADVCINSGNIDPVSIEQKITSKTKAILVVHYAGIPARMSEIMIIAAKHGIKVIEDCAHAMGSMYDGKPIGTLGDFSIFSLQAIKHMTTIDGGIFVSKDHSLLREAKKFRWFGLEKGVPRTEVDITSVGYKYNMNNVTAAIGLAQLTVVDQRLSAHKENGRYFDANISSISGLSVPYFDDCADPSYWLYTIFSDDADNIQKCLSEIGVYASKLHRPNHLHSLFRPYVDSLPQLDVYYEKMIHIPCGWWVSEELRVKMVEALQRG